MFHATKCIFALFCIINLTSSQGSCPPDGWSKFKDEKCFQLVETFSNFADARSSCISRGGTLAILDEEEQQLFLLDYIFLQGAAEVGVWIGATRKSNSDFEWEDGTPVIYSNWGVDSPSNLEGRDCVAIQSRFSRSITKNDIVGTWRDMSCISPMYFLCERVPMWTDDQIRAILIKTRKSLEETRSHLDNVLENPVPIGFIYTQLPGQQEPSSIWPLVTWAEVTSQFAGNFFRAAGGGAAAFGETQTADAPRLTQIRNERTGNNGLGATVNTSPGGWSGVIVSGDEAIRQNNFGLQFFINNVENRPVNTAVRIWIRQS